MKSPKNDRINTYQFAWLKRDDELVLCYVQGEANYNDQSENDRKLFSKFGIAKWWCKLSKEILNTINDHIDVLPYQYDLWRFLTGKEDIIYKWETDEQEEKTED